MCGTEPARDRESNFIDSAVRDVKEKREIRGQKETEKSPKTFHWIKHAQSSASFCAFLLFLFLCFSVGGYGYFMVTTSKIALESESIVGHEWRVEVLKATVHIPPRSIPGFSF